jgi:V/A-type H+-transporting ATPase subunit F
MKVLVIGHPDAVLGFSLVGIRGKVASSALQVNQALDEALATSGVGIVLVTNDAARLAKARVNQLKLRSNTPLVVEIPGPEGVQPGELSLNEVVFRAIGIKI